MKWGRIAGFSFLLLILHAGLGVLLSAIPEAPYTRARMWLLWLPHFGPPLLAAVVFFWLGLIQRERLLLHAVCVMVLQALAAFLVIVGIERLMHAPPAPADPTAALDMALTIVGALFGLALGFRVRQPLPVKHT